MPTSTQFTLQGLMPARDPDLAAVAPFALAAGGPVGVCGAYPQGMAFGLIGGAVANHVLTLTLTKNSATGLKGYFTYYGDKVYSGLAVTGGITANAATAFPSAAQMQAALTATVPGWSGNVTGAGNDTANYTFTFGTLLASKHIGGLLTFTVTAYTAGGGPTGAITVTTKGCAGAAQAEPYATGGTPNRVDGFLINTTTLDPTGAIVAGDGRTTYQAAGGVSMYTAGTFWADNTNYPEKSVLVGASTAGYIDANALTLGKLTLVQGVSLSDSYSMIRLR